MSVITKKIKEQKCFNCNGLGKVNELTCSICKGTGIYTGYYSYFIDDNKKIAFDGEPGQ